jgi:hypothetical protein
MPNGPAPLTPHRRDLSVEDAIELGRRAIYHATFRDCASGGTVSGASASARTGGDRLESGGALHAGRPPGLQAARTAVTLLQGSLAAVA